VVVEDAPTSASSLQFDGGTSNGADVVDSGSQGPHTPTTTAQSLLPSPSGKRSTKSVSECDHSSSYSDGSGNSDSDSDNVTDSEPDMEESARHHNATHALAPAAAAKPRPIPSSRIRKAAAQPKPRKRSSRNSFATTSPALPLTGALSTSEENREAVGSFSNCSDRWKCDATQTSTGGIFKSKVNSVHLRPMSQGLSFVWATIHRDVALSQSNILTLKQVLGNEGELEDLLLQPLNNSRGTRWLLTCFYHSPAQPNKIPMAPKQASLGSSLQKRAQALLDRQYDDKAIEMANTATSEKNEGLDADDDSGADGSDDENIGRQTRRNRKWSDLERERLRAYVNEGMEWKWIFKQFPGRTDAAVRTQVSLLRK
jgi:hypothetical protein